MTAKEYAALAAQARDAAQRVQLPNQARLYVTAELAVYHLKAAARILLVLAEATAQQENQQPAKQE